MQVVVPPIIAAEGSVNGRSLRRIGHEAIAEMTRTEAAVWQRNPERARLNPELAAELLKETA